jgi:hypothetical protein
VFGWLWLVEQDVIIIIIIIKLPDQAIALSKTCMVAG